MGGGAFAQAFAPGAPTLRTPRMSPQEYRQVRDGSIEKLQRYLPGATVGALIEAPEKVDYGDLDLFIATDEPLDLVDVANRLGAAGVISHSSRKATLAVPKTIENDPTTTPIVYQHWHGKGNCPSNTITQEEYAQLDLEVVSPAKLDWFVFYAGYGDMAGLIGHIVTQLGFTVSDTGFWLRLVQLEASRDIPNVNVADRDGMIFLSSEPHAVMKFLGCSQEQYDAGFKTIDALYEWLGSCRLLSPEAIKIKRNNSHERNREEKRSVYSRFFNEWLPARMEVPAAEDSNASREKMLTLRKKYLHEAVDFFAVRREYETKQVALQLALNNGLAASLIKPMIAEHSEKDGKQLNEIVRAFRRHVTFDQTNRPLVIAKPHSDAESELNKFLSADCKSLQDAQGTSEWIRSHWQEVRSLERQRGKGGMPANV